MSMSGPNCPKCGAASQNPSASQCAYCGSALSAPQPPQAFGAPPGQYGAPPGQYGAPPGQYGAPPGQYGAPPGQYGAPPGQYGAPPGQYGAPPGQYGGPQPPVFHSGPQVQPFGGANYGQNFHRPNGFMSAVGSVGNAMFWIRLAIAVVVLFVFAMGSCINALTHGY